MYLQVSGGPIRSGPGLLADPLPATNVYYGV
jgi:hypothetical protein